MSDAPAAEQNPISLPAEHTKIAVDSEQQQAGVITHNASDEIEKIQTELGSNIEPIKDAVLPATSDSGRIIISTKDAKSEDVEWGNNKFDEYEKEKKGELKNAA